MFLLVFISLLLLAFYTALILYYQRAWTAIPVPPAASGPSLIVQHSFTTKISVLIPARNEEKNIRVCLESLSRQHYPRELYEVIVIDDHSTDRTAAIVGEYGVRCLRLAEWETGSVKAYKKFAIETGIGAATGELIVTTDADCWSGPDWLATIAAFYETRGAKFIAAPVRIGDAGKDAGGVKCGGGGKADAGKDAEMLPGKGVGAPGSRSSFLAIFQTLDFLTLQGITGAAVSRRFHSMCNGANLAYEKKAFYAVGGFRGIDNIPSGDDMLLMHKIYQRYPEQVFFLKQREAIVSTRPETHWKGFINQRVRWASKADQYDDKRIFWVLLLVYILNLLFIGLLVASFFNTWYLWVLLILLVVKIVAEYPFVRSVAGFFGQQGLMVYFPVMQPFHILYTVVIGWLGKFGSYHWKDRKVNK